MTKLLNKLLIYFVLYLYRIKINIDKVKLNKYLPTARFLLIREIIRILLVNVKSLIKFLTLCFVRKKPNIWLFSHDSSPSGAPLLSFAIIKYLSRNYDVSTIVPNNGELIPYFLKYSSVFVIPHIYRFRKIFLGILFCIRRPSYVVLNSIANGGINFSFLAKRTKTILLIHEFPDYIDHNLIRYNIFNSTISIFSSDFLKAVYENTFPDIDFSGKNIAVLHQGKIPISEILRVSKEKFIKFKFNKEKKYILSVGYIQFRKGYDIFINTCIELAKKNKKVDFIWVGDELDKNHFIKSMSDYMIPKKYRHRFHHIGSSRELDYFYKNSDVMLVSSRQDPLPNVAIDFLSYKKPVFYFKDTTGLYSLYKTLANNNAKSIEYFNHLSLISSNYIFSAAKLNSYLSNSKLKKNLCDAITLSCDKLSFKNYMIQFKLLFNNANNQFLELKKITENFTNEYKKINSNYSNLKKIDLSAEIRKNFNGSLITYSLNPLLNFSNIKNNLDYLKNLNNKNYFIPIYKQQKKIIKSNNSNEPLLDSLIVHYHIFYIDVFYKFYYLISNINTNFIFTVHSIALKKELESFLKSKPNHSFLYKIVLVKNIGADIFPLVYLHKNNYLTKYTYICHIHTKKSIQINRYTGLKWSFYLFDTMLDLNFVDLLNFMKKNNLVMGFPIDNNLLNFIGFKKYFKNFNINEKRKFSYVNAPVGSFFISEIKMLSFFFDKCKIDQFENHVADNFTLAHFFERAFISLLPKKYRSKFFYIENKNGFSR